MSVPCTSSFYFFEGLLGDITLQWHAKRSQLQRISQLVDYYVLSLTHTVISSRFAALFSRCDLPDDMPDQMLLSPKDAQAAQSKASAAMSLMQTSMPNKEEAEEFSKKVDEIAMLVDGLSKGTLTPEYIDSKLEREQLKVAEKKAMVCLFHVSGRARSGIGE
jgi:TnpA family transposase